MGFLYAKGRAFGFTIAVKQKGTVNMQWIYLVT